MRHPWALAQLLLLGVTLQRAADAQVVEANAGTGDGNVYASSGSVDGGKYYGQWTVGDLTCYIAKDVVNGAPKVVKECKNGFLGVYHPMTKEEEAIIENEIKRVEEQKRIMQQKIAESNAIMQNSMRSMNNQIQRSVQGMHQYMNQMQQMMQQQFQNAFGMYG